MTWGLAPVQPLTSTHIKNKFSTFQRCCGMTAIPCGENQLSSWCPFICFWTDAHDLCSLSDPLSLGVSRTLFWKPVHFLLRRSVQNHDFVSTNQLFLTHIPSTLHHPHIFQNVTFIDGIFLWFPALPLIFWLYKFWGGGSGRKCMCPIYHPRDPKLQSGNRGEWSIIWILDQMTFQPHLALGGFSLKSKE